VSKEDLALFFLKDDSDKKAMAQKFEFLAD
jgi:hypothetical protein